MIGLELDILAVLRDAADPMSNPEIRERIAKLDDVAQVDAQHLVADALTALIGTDQVERVWSEGRARYVINPSFQALAAGVSEAPPAPVLAAEPALPAQVIATDPIPSPSEVETVMSDNDSMQAKIIGIITKAGGEIASADLRDAMPRVPDVERKRQLTLLCASGKLVRSGVTANVRFCLAGHVPSDAAPAKPRKEKAAPKREAPTKQPVADVPAIERPIATTLSPADLRAAAAAILLSHGSLRIPRALHRLVLAAVGEPA